MTQQQELSVTLGDTDHGVIEQVRQLKGFNTVEQAAEWLLKTGLRRSVCAATGTSRRLRLVISKTIQDCQ